VDACIICCRRQLAILAPYRHEPIAGTVNQISDTDRLPQRRFPLEFLVSTPVASPILSICIPTYNRARYLRTLLSTLAEQLADFPHTFELVISDNASPDGTQEVIAAFEAQLPIRHFRQTENVGGFVNWNFVMSEARGEFVMYLADDDVVIGQELANAIGQMLARPEVGVAYTPWILFDIPTLTKQSQFYSVPETFQLGRGDFKHLLDVILQFRIWPEISIARRRALREAMLHIPDTAFCFFVHAAEYLARSPVLFLKEPFYVSVTRHFEGDQREQAGNTEVQYAWDRYRGGLEYILARAVASGISGDEHRNYLLKISAFVCERLCVAIRMRLHAQQNPVEIFYMALRVVALGGEANLPQPLGVLRSKAALHFVATDVQLNLAKNRLLIVGGTYDDVTQAFLLALRPGELTFVATVPELDAMRDALVYVSGDQRAALSLTDAELATANIRVVHEVDLRRKFFW
jgi:glycosyltransferase involved in cell wall biosynthesis